MRNLVYFIILMACISCARVGSPSGGPSDETPPKFLSSTPDTLSLNVDTNLKEIRINFDEYIVLKDPTKQIVTSPNLGANVVTFSPVGTARKYVQIKFNEKLQPNTTYNINFGNAIQDNNEGNKLPYFQYVFSTGDYIDSLEIKGNVSVMGQKKLAENLLVALYKVDSTYNDSIILTEKPFYIARVDEQGKFKLNYLNSAKYQVIAFEDKIDNMQFDFGKEKIGFLDLPIDLTENMELKINISDQKPNYKANKATQKDFGHIVFKTTGNPEELEIEPLDFEFTTEKITYKPKSDSLNFWFNPSIDSIEEKSKRIKFIVKNKDIIDTLSTVYSNNLKHTLILGDVNKGNLTPSKKLKFKANYPLVKIDSSFITVAKDSTQIPFKIVRDLESDHAFTLDFKVDLQSKYNVTILPEALEDFFGKTINDTLKLKFQTKTKNDFGNLKLTLQNKPEKSFWIQLLNKKDEIIDEKYSTDSVFDYTFLSPGEYYFRILVDENENGFWDAGDFFTRTQSEKAFIYPQMFNVRALWDLDETWVLPKENEVLETKIEIETD